MINICKIYFFTKNTELKYCFAICFIILSVPLTHSQDIWRDIQGDWVKYKAEMKDGSKLFDKSIKDSTYLKFTFKDNLYHISFTPVMTKASEFENNFTIDKNLIRRVDGGGYIIEKLSKDTIDNC